MKTLENDAIPRTKPTRRASSGDAVVHPGRPPREAHYQQLQRLYAWYAPRYDRLFAGYSETTLARALAGFDDVPPGRLLDVACGTGLFAAKVRERWPMTPVVGVDLSPEMLERAAERLPRAEVSEREPSTAWLVGSAESLPLADGAVDTLVCTNAFHLVQEPIVALAEFRRVLRAGGRLVLVDWCRDYWSMQLLLAVLSIVRRQRRRTWGRDELAAAVAAAGFRIGRAERFRFAPIWGLTSIVAFAESAASATTPKDRPRAESRRRGGRP